MDGDQGLKHMCKICNKMFPCGRSLGGHMRSHLLNNENLSNNPKKLLSIYSLRENPKKKWRISDIVEEDRDKDKEDGSCVLKFCRECGKGFPSWKALFGHMKSHSEKDKSLSNSFEEQQNSWTCCDDDDDNSQFSDMEANKVLNKKPRSERRTRRSSSNNNNMVTTATTSSSPSFGVSNTTTTSVSESEHEQEEVAMCLIMLSRDVGNWGVLNSVGESSDNNTMFGDGTVAKRKLKKVEEMNSEVTLDVAKTEFAASGNCSKVNKLAETGDMDPEFSFGTGMNGDLKTQVSPVQAQSSVISSNKRKLIDTDEHVLKMDSAKRSKFECTTCNRSFHSYQALGGHRASHKKLFGSNETSVETEPSPDSLRDTKIVKSCNKIEGIAADRKVIATRDEKLEVANGSKKNKVHECPICFKVFPSGQALGGHKRSHLLRDAGAKLDHPETVVQKPIPEIRDFLDLNLPAPVEDEGSSHESFMPWWLGSSSSQANETPVGLITN